MAFASIFATRRAKKKIRAHPEKIAGRGVCRASIVTRIANHPKMIRDSYPLFAHCNGASRSTLACVRQGKRTGLGPTTIANI
jgi:hypothetical protein